MPHIPKPSGSENLSDKVAQSEAIFVSDLVMTRITGPFPRLRATDRISRRSSVNWIYKSRPLPTVTAGSAQWRNSAVR